MEKLKPILWGALGALILVKLGYIAPGANAPAFVKAA
jgi:hypothetical protein